MMRRLRPLAIVQRRTPMMANLKTLQTRATRFWIASTLAAVMLMLLQVSAQADSKSATDLPRSSPEAQGIASSAILAFVEEADQKIDHLHSFLLVRHGKV